MGYKSVSLSVSQSVSGITKTRMAVPTQVGRLTD
jgi:hypothetical protein